MDIASLIMSEAGAQGVDLRLALEVAIQESHLNPSALSPKGAIGVFQLMPATAAALGVDPHDILQNIRGGIRYLGDQLARFGDTAMALAAYNWGPGNVNRWGKDWFAHAPAETREYVAAIMSSVDAEYRASVGPIPVPIDAIFPPERSDENAIDYKRDWRPVVVVAGVVVGVWVLSEMLG